MTRIIPKLDVIKLLLCVLILGNGLFFFFLLSKTNEKQIEPEWNYSIALEGKKSFYQWNSDSKNLILPAQHLRGEVIENHPFPVINKEKEKPVKLIPLSELKSSMGSKHTLCIIYDQYEKREMLKNPIAKISREGMNRFILIDVSSTMNQKDRGEELNRLSQVYYALIEKRKETDETWHLYTFSDNLKEVGKWNNGKNIFPHLQRGKGRTYLLKALEQLKPNLKKPTNITIITDGFMTETDRSSYENTLVDLSSEGHQLSVLTPKLQKAESLDEFYQRGLLRDLWGNTKSKKEKTMNQKSRLNGTLWKNVFYSRGNSLCKPFLWSEQGLPLAYIENTQYGKLVHLTGNPTDGGKELEQILNEQFNSIIIFSASSQKREIDIRSHQSQPLRVWKDAWLDCDSVFSGVFDFSKLGLEHKSSLKFFHPKTGFFNINNLDSLNILKKSFSEKETVKSFNIEGLDKKISPTEMWWIYILTFVNILLVSSILLLRKFGVQNL